MECTPSSSQEEMRGVVDSSPIEDGEALLQAARLGRVSDVRYLIKEKGCDPMRKYKHGQTVLHKAALLGKLKIVQCLIDEFGVDPKSCRDDKGWTPLHEAAQGGEPSVLRYLIKEKGCDPMNTDEHGETVLHAAAFKGDLQVTQCLIDECSMDPKSCIDPKLISSRNLRICEYLKSKIPTFELVEQKVSATSNDQLFANSSNQLPPSTEREKKLVSGDLHQISSYLHDIPNEDLLRLGLALGLNYIKLKRQLEKGTFLLDMLAMWLREEDDVIKSSGPPTWRSLVKALRADTVTQNGIADTIEKCHL